jgi:hypothetical protein
MASNVAAVERRTDEHALAQASTLNLVASLRATAERARRARFWLGELRDGPAADERVPGSDTMFDHYLRFLEALQAAMEGDLRRLFEARTGRPLPDPEADDEEIAHGDRRGPLGSGTETTRQQRESTQWAN